jgi:hypothetical protein
MRYVLLLFASLLPATIFAHGGGLDASGCHNDRKRGGYHCHRGSYEPPAPQPIRRKAEPDRRNDEPQTLFGSAGSIAYDADVETAQKLLTELGYSPGEPDGLMGEKTRSAVRAFEKDNGRTVTGLVTQDLISALIGKVAE